MTLTPDTGDAPQCVSTEGSELSNSVLNVIGWVEFELGILGIGCLTAKLWVTTKLRKFLLRQM